MNDQHHEPYVIVLHGIDLLKYFAKEEQVDIVMEIYVNRGSRPDPNQNLGHHNHFP